MKTKGLRIVDSQNTVEITVNEVLSKVPNGNDYYWSILWLEVKGDLGEDIDTGEFCNHINKSLKGAQLNWFELVELCSKFWTVEEIILVGSKTPIQFGREKDDQERYDLSDIFIQRFDNWFWIFYSKDEKFLKNLENDFKIAEFLETK